MRLLQQLISRRGLLIAGATVAAALRFETPAWAEDAAQPEAKPPVADDVREEWIEAIAVSRDGRLLAAASTSHAIAVWEIATGKQTHEFIYPATQNSVGALLFAEDGGSLLVGNAPRRRSHGQALIVYDLGEDASQRTVTADIESIGAFATSAKAGVIASIGLGNDSHVRLWEKQALTMERLWPAHRSTVRAVAMSPDGRVLASSGSNWKRSGHDPSLKLWDADTGRLLHTLTGHRYGARILEFSADGRRLFSFDDEAVKSWNTATGKLIATSRYPATADVSTSLLAVAPGAAWFALAIDEGDGKIVRTSIRTVAGREIGSWLGGAQTRDVQAVSPDARLLFNGSSDGMVAIREVSTGAILRTLTLDDKPARKALQDYEAEKAKAEAAKEPG